MLLVGCSCSDPHCGRTGEVEIIEEVFIASLGDCEHPLDNAGEINRAPGVAPRRSPGSPGNYRPERRPVNDQLTHGHSS